MAQHVELRNTQTGEIKTVKVGFSWTLFFFSGVFGIPLFMRKLNFYGGIVAAVCVVNMLVAVSDDPSLSGVTGFLRLIGIGISFAFGFRGNQLTAKNYLDHGWEWVDPEDEDTALAREKWALV